MTLPLTTCHWFNLATELLTIQHVCPLSKVG